MKRIISIILTVSVLLPLRAQTLDAVLQSIERNNTTLKALRETVEAQKLENKTGITLPDPEIGFGYFWNTPDGHKVTTSASQSFDLATVFGQRRQLADSQNELAEWQYQVDRMNILLEAKQYALDLIYYNSLLRELDIRKGHAEAIAESQKKRLDNGEGNKLEYNNVVLSLASVAGEIARVETERSVVVSQLARLNGGAAPELAEASFAPLAMSESFGEWYAEAESRNPVLAYVKQEIEVSRRNLSVSKASGLPSITVGYGSEAVAPENFRGVNVGMSIPLWANKNRVKSAKAAVRAAESREADAKLMFYSNLEILYNRTLGLKSVAETFRSTLETANNSELLKRALDAGSISIVDYLVELGLYYDAVNQALAAERDYQKAHAELTAYML